VFTESLLALVEKTLACMENKILLIAKGAKQFFFLHMIMALVKAKLWPDQAPILKKGVVDRMGVIAYGLLAHHSNATNDAEALEPVCLLSYPINRNRVLMIQQNQPPSLTSGCSVPTPRDSTSALDGVSLPDLAITVRYYLNLTSKINIPKREPRLI